MAEIQSIPLLIAAVGMVLVIGEAIVPGAHLIVLGAALLGAGVTGLLLGISSYLYLGAFALVYGAITFYYYRNLSFVRGDEKGERTTDSNKLRGRVGKVTETVTGDSGQVKIEGSFDPYYMARSAGEEIPVGSRVRVVDPRGGNVLEVEQVREDGADGEQGGGDGERQE